MFTLAEETDAEVRLNNGILVIAFKQPVDVTVGRIPEAASSYVGAARRDPDGAAVRLALTRKVTVNTMAAGEKLFVDLLPEGWTGLPPGLPQEVVEELARRAREAEKKARQQLVTTQHRALPPVRVRVGMQPTFTRYTFALAGADQRFRPSAATIRSRSRSRRRSSSILPTCRPRCRRRSRRIEAQSGHENITLRFEFIGKVDVRTFREDNNYVIDVVPLGARGEADGQQVRRARTGGRGDRESATISAEARASRSAPNRPKPKTPVSRNLPRHPQARPRLQRARRACRFPNPPSRPPPSRRGRHS